MHGVNPARGRGYPGVACGGVYDAADETVDQVQVQHGIVSAEVEGVVGDCAEV